MAQLAPALKAQMDAQPTEPLQVIIRVKDDLEACEARLEAAGFQIRRRLSLIKGFAATGKPAALRQAADWDWVISIELDQPVRAL